MRRIESLKQRIANDRVVLAAPVPQQARRNRRDESKLFAHPGSGVCQVAPMNNRGAAKRRARVRK